VAGRRFTVDEQAYRAAPPAGYVRLYFLSRSHKVVNLEQLPDRPLPPDLTPRGMLKDVATSFFRGSARRAETNATMLSFAHAIVDEQANPPPPEARDPRPLAEAIVGTWTNPLFRLSFAPDGSVAIVMPGGRQRTGAWSVDAAGKLHADISGRELVAGAWVAGDRLTIPIRDGALTFQRQT
jgi:hypothetical protein